MQIEIKCALEFLLSYLYDKLPRRRVNLFGDELEKYLKLKLIASDSKVCLNINFKQDDIELIDPCLIVASKESAMDLKEILECWPSCLKLFIESGKVSYSLDKNMNEADIHDDLVRTIYSEKNDIISVPLSPIQANNINLPQDNQLFDVFQMGNMALNTSFFQLQQQPQQHNQNRRINNNYNTSTNKPFFIQSTINSNENNNISNKSRGLNLNFNNLKPSNSAKNNMAAFNSPTSPCSFNGSVQIETAPSFQQNNDFLSLSSSSSASTSSSSSHLSNPVEDSMNNHSHQHASLLNPPTLLSNVAILTANSKAAAASFGGSNSMFTTAAFAQTKFGSTKSKNNYTRQTKQQKMLPNEFNAYIRNKMRMLNNESSTNFGHNQAADNNLIDYFLSNEQVPSISLSSFTSPMSPTNQPSSFFKSNSSSSGFQNLDNHESQMQHMPYNLNFSDNTNCKNPANYESLIGGSSQLIQPELLITNSTMNELEENLINNYFGSTFSSPSSSTVSSASSSASSYYTGEIGNKSSADMLNPAINDFLSQINNLTI